MVLTFVQNQIKTIVDMPDNQTKQILRNNDKKKLEIWTLFPNMSIK